MLEIGEWSKQDKAFLRAISTLFHNMAVVYQDQGDYIKAMEYLWRALEIGERTNQGADDFTDILVFTYADGSTVTYEFEADWIVNEDGTRNMITGGDLSGLRTLLSEMLDIE